jgi:chromosomal replication initiator protein
LRGEPGDQVHPQVVDCFVDGVEPGKAWVQVTDGERLWKVCAEALRAQVADAIWRTWFEGISVVALDDDTVVLGVPNTVVRERIQGRYLSLVQDAVTDAAGKALRIELELRSSEPEPEPHPEPQVRDVAPVRPAANRVSVGLQALEADDAPINVRFTFDAFVIGDSNRFAHAAARSVAETPARSYNPLFIQGGAGLGKTHLLHAIGNYVRENFPSRHVRYVSTETFMNEFVDAIRTNTGTAFKRRDRECDVLLVDDVQFMEGKEGLQEEFFHTFNSLHSANKRIVITSDRPPRSLATLEDRLRSRFLSGLVADVQPPELETRLAILRKKAEGERAHVPDDVLEFIAENIKNNIRELEGALIRVSAYASLNRQPLDRGLAELVLSDMLAGDQPRQITPQVILQATADMFGFTIDELCGTSRRRPLVQARQVGMYVTREITEFSYPAIAREFGGRDHTTVIHAVEKISALMKERRQIYDQVTTLIHRIKSGETGD